MQMAVDYDITSLAAINAAHVLPWAGPCPVFIFNFCRWRIQTPSTNNSPITSNITSYQQTVGGNVGGISGYTGDWSSNALGSNTYNFYFGTTSNESSSVCHRSLPLCQLASRQLELDTIDAKSPSA
jgi:hypothetical protein